MRSIDSGFGVAKRLQEGEGACVMQVKRDHVVPYVVNGAGCDVDPYMVDKKRYDVDVYVARGM